MGVYGRERAGKERKNGGKIEKCDGGISNGWREGWVVEDAVMRQSGTKVEGKKHGERV